MPRAFVEKVASEKAVAEKALQRLRKRLLDTTGRSNLVKYKESGRSIVVHGPVGVDLFRKLTVNGSPLILRPWHDKTVLLPAVRTSVQPARYEDGRRQQPVSDCSTSKIGHLCQQRSSRGLAALTPYLPKELERRCKQSLRLQRAGIDESGVNYLHAAFGFLYWCDEDSQWPRYKAPLLLLPLTIQRLGLNPQTDCFDYAVQFEGDEWEVNPCLTEKQRRELEVPLADAGTRPDAADVFHLVREAVAGKAGWHVSSEVTIDLFRFTKIRMYKDLSIGAWPTDRALTAHPLVAAILSGTEEIRHANQPEASERSLDPQQDTTGGDDEQLPLILPADGFQHRVIRDALHKERNLVVEGPPGTGKSQTIANLIAVSFECGKSVLFVADKKAALDVVKARLDQSGLGDFVLDLHSHNMRKTRFLADLEHRLSGRYPDDPSLDQAIEELERNVSVLRTYYDSAEQIRSATGDNFFDIVWELERSKKTIQEDHEVDEISGCFDHTEEQVNGHLRVLAELAQAHASLPGGLIRAWGGFAPGNLMPGDEKIIVEQLQEIHQFWRMLKDEMVAVKPEMALTIKDMLFLAGPGRGMLEALPPEKAMSLYEALPGDGCKGLLPELADRLARCRQVLCESEKVLELIAPDGLSRHLEILPMIEGLIARGYGDAGSLDLPVLQESLTDALDRMDRLEVDVKSSGGLFSSISLDRLEKICRLAEDAPTEVLLHPCPMHSHRAAPAILDQAIKENKRLSEAAVDLAGDFRIDRLPSASEIAKLEGTLAEMPKWFGRFFSRRYRHTLERVRTFIRPESALSLVELSGRLADLAVYVRAKADFAGRIDLVETLGSRFCGTETEWPALTAAVDWSQKLAETTGSVAAAQSFISNLDAHMETIAPLERQRQKLLGLLNKGRVPSDKIFSNHVEATDLKAEITHTQESMEKVCRQRIEAMHLQSLTLSEWQRALRAVQDNRALHRELMGTHTDPAMWTADELADLEAAVRWVARMQAETMLPEGLRTWLQERDTRPRAQKWARLANAARDLQYSWDQMCGQLSRCGLLDETKWALAGQSARPIEWLQEKIEGCMATKSHLQAYADWMYLFCHAEAAGLGALAEALAKNRISPDTITDHYRLARCKGMVRELLAHHPHLARAQRAVLENAQSEAAGCWAKMGKHQAIRIAHRLSERPVPQGNGKGLVRDYSELSLIRHELSKKQRHLPIRQLVQRAGGALQVLKPCFMMSPQSVAHYLPPGKLKFDLVIMDEASQLRVEDALGAVARGRQLVITGDSKQLPPTRFFEPVQDRVVNPDNRTAMEEMESILDVGRGCFESRMLCWHYRSRHQDLIEFSNRQFYGNQLVVFPAANGREHPLGIRRHFIEKAAYHKGRNPAEANVVALAVMRHFRETPHLGLGVAAFNLDQRNLIIDAVEKLQKKHAWLDECIEATAATPQPFFVKNLESVQGDERDVIFLSTTYGPDRNSGKVCARFGPLMESGGWRRLNVLVTRARQRIEVFTSMKSTDIDAAENPKDGASLLMAYLAYVEENGSQVDLPAETAAPTTEFQQRCAELVRNIGFLPVCNVGGRKSVIDIGVYCPKKRRYVLGLELDSASSHFGRAVIDRDVLKTNMLIDMGWRLFRVWTVDWYKNRDAVITRIEQVLAELEDETQQDNPGRDEKNLVNHAAKNDRAIHFRLIEKEGPVKAVI